MNNQEKVALYERLHARMFPILRKILQLLFGYVLLFGRKAPESCYVDSARDEREYDDHELSDRELYQMRKVLEWHMGELKDSEFSLLVGIDDSALSIAITEG